MKTFISIFGMAFIFCLLLTNTTAQPSKEEKKIGNPNDVPVISPKKPSIIQEEIAVHEEGDQATLPTELIKNKINTLKVGSTVYANANALRIDNNRKCWLQPFQITGPKSVQRTLMVRRDNSGYHVVIENSDQFEAEDVDGKLMKWIPVKSLTVAE